MPDKNDEKRISNLKKLAYALTGTVAAGAITAAVATNIGFISADFDPNKYTHIPPKKEDDIVFDGVAYSNGNNKENKKKESTQNDKKDEKKDEQKDEQKPLQELMGTASIPIITAEAADNGNHVSETVNFDAAVGNGTENGSNGGFLPVLSNDANGQKSSIGTVTDNAADKSYAGDGGNTAKDDNSQAKQPSRSETNSNDTPKDPAPSGDENDKPNSNLENDPPSNNDGNNDNNDTKIPNDKKNHGSSGGSSSKPSTPTDNSNPSQSQDEAPKRNDSSGGTNTDPGSSSGGHGGHSGIYSGQPVGMEYTGSFTDLCIGQNIDSIFSSSSGRGIYLKFTQGSMTLKNSSTSVVGLNISGLDTGTVHSGNASVSFTYKTEKYNIQIPYNVTQWTAQFYMPDGKKFPSVLKPDENLKLNLSRYYSTLVARYPDFIGWRSAGSDEIYTTECVMTKPEMEFFACLKGDVPDSDEVGEEYTLNGMTDVDISRFNIYPNCRKLVIGESVQNISGGKLAEKFPNLEEIEAAEGNSVYTSYDGVLYKDKTVAVVPPKKTEVKISDSAEKIDSYAFCGSEIKDLVLPETVTEIGSYAFCDAKLDSLTITADRYSVGECAFFASEADSPAVKKIISKTLYTAEAKDGAEDFGKSMPQILLPDSKYDRVYQYYLSSWGYKIDKKYGEGTAVTVFSTLTGAQDRNTLKNGGVYSFFSDKNQYTLTSVSNEFDGVFVADEKTVEVAEDAFYGCSKTTALVFGKNVKKLDDNTLRGAAAINSVTFLGTPPSVTRIFFERAEYKKLKIYVPMESYDDYIAQWSEMIDNAFGAGSAEEIIEINSDDVEVIDGARYIRDENGLVLIRVTGDADSEFTVADGTYKIAHKAFGAKLNRIIIPDTVTEIEENPISAGGSIDSVFINSNLDFSESAFDGCRLFVPETSQYEHEAYRFQEPYKPDGNGVLYADHTLLYVPKNFTGTLKTTDETELILAGAAKGCGKLNRLILSDSVKEIGENAFDSCRSMQSIDISETSELAKIDGKAFYKCVSVAELNLPQSVKEIGESAFYGCDILASISADGIETIGDYAFMRCNSLCRFNSDINLALSDSIKEIGKGAFASCPLITEVKLPSNLRELSEGIFEECVSLYEVTDWGAVEIIGENAFRSCGFISVKLPDTEGLSIKSGAFADNDVLDNIVFRSGIKEIAPDCVEDGAGAILVFSNTVSQPIDADFDAMLENGRINDNIYTTQGTDMSEYFDESRIHESDAGIITVGKQAGVYFSDNQTWATLAKVSKKCVDFDMIDNITVTKINDDAFSDAMDIETVIIGQSVGTMADYMFADHKKLRSFEIQQKRDISKNISFGDGTFKNCTSLETFTVSQALSKIGKGTFENCTELSQVSWGIQQATIPEDTFNGCTNLMSFNITATSLSSVTHIGERCFKDCRLLETVAGLGGGNLVFSNLNSIADNAFEGCANLSGLTLSSTVKSLGSHVFDGCDSMTAVRIGSNPFEIGEKVFGDDAGDKYFYLGNVSDSVYNSFVEAWRERLAEDYGEDSVGLLISREENDPEVPGEDVPVRSVVLPNEKEPENKDAADDEKVDPPAEKDAETPENTEESKNTEESENNKESEEIPEQTEESKEQKDEEQPKVPDAQDDEEKQSPQKDEDGEELQQE